MSEKDGERRIRLIEGRGASIKLGRGFELTGGRTGEPRRVAAPRNMLPARNLPGQGGTVPTTNPGRQFKPKTSG